MKLKAEKMKLKGQMVYVKQKGCLCPNCNSKNIEGGSLEMDGDSAWVKVSCADCGADWKDVYKLTGYTDFSISVTVKPINPADLGDIDFKAKN